MTSFRSTVLAFALGSMTVAAGGSQLAGQEGRDTIRLREIVITATRLPTPVDVVANGVTVVSGDALRARGVSTVLEALREVPGMAVVQTGSFGGVTSLFLRGGESDYVRVLVDGVPVNQPGGAMDLAHLSTDNVERIEIVRGPASVLYGSDAVTGVVHVITRRGTGPSRLGVAARGGTYGAHEVSAEWLGGRRRWSWALAASRFGGAGVHAFNDEYRKATLAASLWAAPDARTEVVVSARRTDNRLAFPTDGAGVPSDSNQHSRGRSSTVGLELARHLTDGVEARLLLAAHGTDDRYDDAPDGPADTTGVYAFRSRAQIARRSADLRLNLRPVEGTVITVGAVVERERERSSNAYESDFGPGGGSTDVARTNRAVYAQLLAAGAGRVSLLGGLRREDNETFGGFTTVRVGVAYRPASAVRLRAAYGTAFKEPTFFENYASGYVTGNPGLRPERSRSVEAGAEGVTASGRLVLAGTLFAQRFRDMIQYTAFPPVTGAPNYHNVAGAEAWGVESELRAVPLGGVDLVLRHTYLRTAATDSGFDGASFAEGERLLRRPTHTVSVAAAYRLGARGSFGLQGLYVGDRAELDFRDPDPATFQPRRIVLPAYVRLDASATYDVAQVRAGRPAVGLTVRIENLLDRHYEEVRYFPARGRTILVGVRSAVGL